MIPHPIFNEKTVKIFLFLVVILLVCEIGMIIKKTSAGVPHRAVNPSALHKKPSPSPSPSPSVK